MARASWQGYIVLGQLGIPVRLFSGTQSIRPRFVQLHEKDGSPVERELYCRAEGKSIEQSEIIKAVEYEDGSYVTLTEEELDSAIPVSDKTITITQFCQPEILSTQYYNKSFYIVPTKGGERAYALLREVLAIDRQVAVTQYVNYGKEYIATIGVVGDILLLQQLRYTSEIVPRSSIKTPPLPKPSPSEIEILRSVVKKFSGPFYIEDYHDDYSEIILELIESKSKGIPLNKTERIPSHATPEDEIEAVLKDILMDTSKTSERVIA